jgi:hypothetical protein
MSNQDFFSIENLELNDNLFIDSNGDTVELCETETIEVDVSSPVYYSYPYYVLNGCDYQYKVSFDDGFLKLEEVKTNDSELEMNMSSEIDHENSICVVQEHELTQGLHMIENLYDIREEYENSEKIETEPKWCDILQLDISKFDKSDASSALENNKKIVLLDLYNYICTR